MNFHKIPRTIRRADLSYPSLVDRRVPVHQQLHLVRMQGKQKPLSLLHATTVNTHTTHTTHATVSLTHSNFPSHRNEYSHDSCDSEPPSLKLSLYLT